MLQEDFFRDAGTHFAIVGPQTSEAEKMLCSRSAFPEKMILCSSISVTTEEVEQSLAERSIVETLSIECRAIILRI